MHKAIIDFMIYLLFFFFLQFLITLLDNLKLKLLKKGVPWLIFTMDVWVILFTWLIKTHLLPWSSKPRPNFPFVSALRFDITFFLETLIRLWCLCFYAHGVTSTYSFYFTIMRSGHSSWSSFSFGGVISTSCCHFSIIRSGQSSWFPISSRLVFCFVGVCVISLKTLSTFVKLVLYYKTWSFYWREKRIWFTFCCFQSLLSSSNFLVFM